MIITRREKDKTALQYYNDQGKVQYTVVLNNGVPTFRNVISRKDLQKVPVAVRQYVREHGSILDDVMSTKLNYTNEEMELYERLDGLQKKVCDYWDLHKRAGLIEYVQKNWKAIVKQINGSTQEKVSLSVIIETLENEKLCEMAGDYLPRLSDDEKKVLVYLIKENNQNEWWKEEYVSVIAYWLTHHVYDFFRDDKIYISVDQDDKRLRYGGRKIRINPFQCRNNAHDFVNDVTIMLKLATDFNLNLKKTDYFRMHHQIKEMYKQMMLSDGENDRFSKNQNAIAEKVKFNYEGYTVMLPLAINDLKDESINQHNCVYSIHTDYVLRGDEYIVFIRKQEEPEKSLITCSIDTDGQITGYLTKNNSSVTDKTLKDFKREFQKHLNEVWKSE